MKYQGEVALSYRAAVKSNIPEPPAAVAAPAAVEVSKASEAAPTLKAPVAPPTLNVASISEGNSDYQSEPATASTDDIQRAVANGLPDNAGFGKDQRSYQQGNDNREFNRDGRRGGRGRGGGRDYNNQGGGYRGRGNPQQAAPALTTPMSNQAYDLRYTAQQQQYYTPQQQQQMQQQMQQQGYGQLMVYATAQPGVYSVLTQSG